MFWTAGGTRSTRGEPTQTQLNLNQIGSEA